MIDIGKQKVKIDCPNCNRSVQITLMQISKQHSINCSGCNHVIEFQDKDNSVKNGIRDSKKAFAELEKIFKKLGK